MEMVGCRPVEMWRWWGRRVGEGRLEECVKDDMEVLGLHPEWAMFRDVRRGFISGQTSNPS